MWDIRRHLWEWVNSKVDFVVVHVETSYKQRGTGKLDVGEFGKEAERLVDQINRQTVWERVRGVVGFDTKGGPRGDGEKEC